MNREKIYIYGKHALVEALVHAPQALKKVFLAKGVASAEIMSRLKNAQISIAPLTEQKGVAKDASHQGFVAIVDPVQLIVQLETFLQTLPITPATSIVVLDGLQDPHNVGVAIRSSAAFGASCVIMAQSNQAPLTGATIKASVGMAFRIPLVVTDLPYALRLLKGKGFTLYGLAMDGARSLTNEVFTTPSVFVIGNEGSGVQKHILKMCDARMRIPMHSRTESLNAATSLSTVLYEWSKQHPESLR